MVGLRRTSTGSAQNHFLPPTVVKSVQIYKASRNTYNPLPARQIPTTPDLKIILNLHGRMEVRGPGDETTLLIYDDS